MYGVRRGSSICASAWRRGGLPDDVVFVDALPMTATGKVNKMKPARAIRRGMPQGRLMADAARYRGAMSFAPGETSAIADVLQLIACRLALPLRLH